MKSRRKPAFLSPGISGDRGGLDILFGIMPIEYQRVVNHSGGGGVNGSVSGRRFNRQACCTGVSPVECYVAKMVLYEIGKTGKTFAFVCGT